MQLELGLFTIQDLLTWLLIFVGIIAVVALIVVLVRVAKLLKPAKESVEKVDKMLDDVQVCVNNVKEGSEQAKTTLKKASDSFAAIEKTLRRGPMALVSGAAALATSLLGIKKKK